MSAKEAYWKPALQIDKLPHELLGEIFFHATWVPYKIDPSDMVFSHLQSSESRVLYWEYRVSLVTRRYLVRVCKLWYKIAALYLYQWVVLGRPASLPGLQAAVRRSQSDDDNEIYGSVGWYTKRLDISFRRDNGDEIDEEGVGNLLVDLLRALPNLEVLTVKHSFGTRWLDPSVSHTFCPGLRILNWYHGKDIIIPEIWDHFIASHPDLTAVHLPCNGSHRHIGSNESIQPHMLQTYSVRLCDPPSPLPFPSLKRLIISLFPSDRVGLSRPSPNLKPYTSLSSLTTVQLNYIQAPGFLNLYDELSGLAHYFALFQNLQRIDLVLPVWPGRWSPELPPHFPCTVSVLGFRVASSKPPKILVMMFLTWLGRLVRDATSPLAIQFLDSRTMKNILIHRSALLREGPRKHVLSSWLDPDGKLFELGPEYFSGGLDSGR